MAKKSNYVIESDGLDEIEKNILIEQFGKEEAEKILANEDDEPLDEDVQSIVDNAPALDEI